MRSIILGLTAALCAAVAIAEDSEGKKSATEMREAVLRKTGGFVVAPATGRGIRLVDAKSGAPKAAIEKFIKAVATGPRFSVVMTDGNPAEQYMPNEEWGAVIVIKNDPACPMTIMTAPEQGWASVNIAPLLADSPDDGRLQQRVCKEVWRALVYMLGGGNNQMPACVMKPCAGNKDIDDLKMEQPCPDPFREMGLSAGKLGIAQAKLTSYRKACVEGWAPAPANDYQKAIWDEVHAMPTEPIKIKPEEKKTEK